MKVRRRVFSGLATVLTLMACGFLVHGVQSQPPAEPPAATAVTPPADQTYTGKTKCASCHLKQYKAWKATKHSTDAFAKLPAKYKTDVTCLPCHSTGYGAATGFKDEASTPALAGTTCEACHGPGSKHAEVAKQYGEKKLTAEEEAKVRGTIYKTLPQNVCMRCHATQVHKEHPKYDKE
jgi:DnaJ-class molecular chaperone